MKFDMSMDCLLYTSQALFTAPEISLLGLTKYFDGIPVSYTHLYVTELKQMGDSVRVTLQQHAKIDLFL